MIAVSSTPSSRSTSRLWRASEVSESIVCPGFSVVDGNDDGWPDLYLLNMQGDDQYYENQGGHVAMVLRALASLVAVLIGGVLLGIVGVLVAIPVAAAIRLLLQEVAFPRLDKS